MKQPEIREKGEFIEIVYTVSKEVAITYGKVRRCLDNNLGIVNISDEAVYEEIKNLIVDEYKVVCVTFGIELEKLEKRLLYMAEKGILKEEIPSDEIENYAFEMMEIVCPPIIICNNMPTIFHYIDNNLDNIVKTLTEYLSKDYIEYFKALCTAEKYLCEEFYNGYVVIECFMALDIEECRNTTGKQIKTYLMEDNSGLYKIGCSIDPYERLNSMKTGNTTIKLVCVINKNIEKQLHIKFANKRIKGEWFRLTKQDVNDIRKLSKQ